MGIFTRPDSRYYWLWLEHVQKKERTDILLGTDGETRKANRAAAERVYHAKMLALGLQAHGLGPPPEKPTTSFHDFAAWYDTHIVAHHRGVVREREILTTLKAAFTCGLHEITKAAVMEWRTARARATSPATANREVAVLKHLFASAVPQYLEESPIKGLKQLRMPRTDAHVLTREEEAKLLAVLPAMDQAIVICALDTLMRLTDVIYLKRAQDRGAYLLVTDPKIAPYQVPVSTRLRAALNGLPKDGPYYFKHRHHERPEIMRSMVKNMLKRACDKAGVVYGRALGGITFHCLRHTGASRMVDAGVSLRVIQELGGWKSMRQLERYAHPTEQAKRDAVEKISALPVPARRTRKTKQAANA